MTMLQIFLPNSQIAQTWKLFSQDIGKQRKSNRVKSTILNDNYIAFYQKRTSVKSQYKTHVAFQYNNSTMI